MSAEAWVMVIVAIAAYAGQFGAQWTRLKALGKQVDSLVQEIRIMRSGDLMQIQDRLTAREGLARIEARLDALPCTNRPCPLPEE